MPGHTLSTCQLTEDLGRRVVSLVPGHTLSTCQLTEDLGRRVVSLVPGHTLSTCQLTEDLGRRVVSLVPGHTLSTCQLTEDLGRRVVSLVPGHTLSTCQLTEDLGMKIHTYVLVLVGLGNGSRDILKYMALNPPTGTLLLPVTKSNSLLCCSGLNPYTTSQKFLNRKKHAQVLVALFPCSE